jgi:hypothetical protein
MGHMIAPGIVSALAIVVTDAFDARLQGQIAAMRSGAFAFGV